MRYIRGKYQSGGTAIACAYDDGTPCCPLSICLEGFRQIPPENQIVVPKYGLPQCVYEDAIADIVKAEICELTYGDTVGVLVELKDEWKELTEENV